MNQPTLLLTLGAAVLLAPLTSTLAQTWETVDELTPWRGRDIVADSAGNFISLASDNGATTPVSTAVNLSTDQGATWETVGSIAGYALDLTSAPDGALFAVGNRSATVSGRAFVWQSLDYGATWTEINPWAGQSGTFLCMDVAAGNADSIYACGYVGTKWVVRKGQRTPTGGITWTTADNIPGTQPDSICVRPSVVPGQADEILVCGLAAGKWTVRRSVNGGATWTTIDSYSTSMQRGYSGVATGPGSSIYVVGRISKVVGKTTQYGWLVRKSANNGASWTNMDYFVNGWPGNAPIAVDASDRVLIAGFINATPQSWLVRGSSDGGATWVNTDSYPNDGATRSQAQAVAIDELGNVCVTGETGSTAATYTAPIRRLAAP